MLERLFRLTANETSVRREILAGTTTFLTMAYIVFVNPGILSAAGLDFGAVFTATCLAAAVGTLFMGIVANYPIALAPLMGENTFFATVVLAGVAGTRVSWEIALAAVFLSGVLFLVLTLFRIREMIIDAVPASLKHAIASAIGLFIVVIGLVNSGIVLRRGPQDPSLVPVQLGDVGSAPPLIALAGTLVTAVLLVRRVRGAILIGLVLTAGAGWVSGHIHFTGVLSAPPSLEPTFLMMDLRGVFSWSVLPVVLIFLYMAVFDAIGTLVGIADRAGFLTPEGKLPRATRALFADASATVVGAALGTSTTGAYIESAAGVQEGGRTGLANVVTGALFLVTLFVSPIAAAVASPVVIEGRAFSPFTAPALILVGCLMAQGIARIRWDDLTDAVPAFLVIVLMPFTWSIADGIAAGFIAYPVLKIASGRAGEASWLVRILGVLFLARYLFLPT
jgi:AGZA family xanthine/uracil permease-like MFS transporter